MVRLILAYLVSFLVLVIAFLLLYTKIFDSMMEGFYAPNKWDSEIRNVVFYPMIGRLALLHLIVFGLIILPVIWLVKKKLATKQLMSFIVFLSIGLMISAVTLASVEPIIATDLFEYGERQEYNKVIEAVGYSYFNVLSYLSLCVACISIWFLTQFKSQNVTS